MEIVAGMRVQAISGPCLGRRGTLIAISDPLCEVQLDRRNGVAAIGSTFFMPDQLAPLCIWLEAEVVDGVL